MPVASWRPRRTTFALALRAGTHQMQLASFPRHGNVSPVVPAYRAAPVLVRCAAASRPSALHP